MDSFFLNLLVPHLPPFHRADAGFCVHHLCPSFVDGWVVSHSQFHFSDRAGHTQLQEWWLIKPSSPPPPTDQHGGVNLGGPFWPLASLAPRDRHMEGFHPEPQWELKMELILHPGICLQIRNKNCQTCAIIPNWMYFFPSS